MGYRSTGVLLLVIVLSVQLQVNSECEQGVGRCEWESWGPWSQCSRTCAGLRTRTRNMCCGIHIPDCIDKCERPNTSVETEPCETHCPNGGSFIDGICHCPALRYGVCCERNESKSHDCARHCTWNNWNPWDDCSNVTDTECGCGTRSRQRDLCCANNLNRSDCLEDCNMTSYDSSGHRICTSAPPRSSSSTTPCDLCAWNSWESWTLCSQDCGGQRSRSRTPRCCNDTVIEDCLFDCGLLESDIKEEESCGKVCYNNGSFLNSSCQCTEGFHGNCCEIELTEDNCTKCSLHIWNVWGPCSHTCGTGHRTRSRSPCCRTGQDPDECTRQCSVDAGSLTEVGECAVLCCDRLVPAYLYILAGAGSAAGAIIITSLFWCVCGRGRRTRTGEHVYDRPSYNVTNATTGETDYANAAYDGKADNTEEEHYDKLREPTVTCSES